MLLSRVAEHLYWAARYLERAENTARIVREHTNFLVDLPISVSSTWEPLLAVTGDRAGFGALHPHATEAAIVRFLVADRENASSVSASIAAARENLRTCREVLPREAWLTINDLHLYVTSHEDEGVDRRSRGHYLEQVINSHQQALGYLLTTMSRDEAYRILRLGRHLERADMTTVLDVKAGSAIDDVRPEAKLYEDVLWTSVLRSLSALQMFHRMRRVPVGATETVSFVLHEPSFPRSVRYCLQSVSDSLGALPAGDEIRPAAEVALQTLATVEASGLTGKSLHLATDALQMAIGDIHDRVANAYFPPPPAPS